MRRRIVPERAGRLIVAAGCAWELAALWTPLPTITHMCHVGRQSKIGRAAIAGVLAAIAHHLLFEARNA